MKPPAIIYGVNAVMEALAAGIRIAEVQLAGGGKDANRRDIEKLARSQGVRVIKVPRRDLDRLTKGGVHQGVVAVGGGPELVDLEQLAAAEPGPSGRVVVVCLDEVQDPRNLGALARTGLAFGAAGLVITARRSAGLSPGALKASAGALVHLPVARVSNLVQGLDRLKELGFWVAGASADGEQTPWEMDPGDRVALVLGSEGSGLRRSVAKRLDFSVRIPMSGPAESLNVSVAGALLLYEWLGRPRG